MSRLYVWSEVSIVCELLLDDIINLQTNFSCFCVDFDSVNMSLGRSTALLLLFSKL